MSVDQILFNNNTFFQTRTCRTFPSYFIIQNLQILINIQNSMQKLFQQSKTLIFIVYNCQGTDRIQMV